MKQRVLSGPLLNVQAALAAWNVKAIHRCVVRGAAVRLDVAFDNAGDCTSAATLPRGGSMRSVEGRRAIKQETSDGDD